MRAIELSFLIAVILSVTGTLFLPRKNDNAIKVISGITVILFILHIIFDGLRWQMALVYLSMAALTIVLNQRLTSLLKPKHMTPAENLLKILSIVFLIITICLLWMFPVRKMPAPDGPYKIGTAVYELFDDDRMEIYGPTPGSPRRIKFQIWYPADELAGGERTKWMIDGPEATTGIPKMYGIPGFLLHHTALVDSNSYEGVKISSKEETFPLVIISHGWTGFMNLHSDLAEMLASYGYIAVSINHTYGAIVSVFVNGDVIYADPNALPDRDSVDNFNFYSNQLVNTYSLDTALVLDFLSELNKGPGLLEKKINMDAIGVLGHSTGGGGIVQLAVTDSRVKSVFGMDAWVEPIDQEILKMGLKVPACLLRSEQWETGLNNDFLQQLISASESAPDIFQITGCNHQDFSMLYMYNPMTAIIGSKGSMDNRENAAIQQDWVLSFFNNTLKNRKTNLDQLDDKYEAVVRVRDFNK